METRMENKKMLFSHVSVDCVLLGVKEDTLCVLLVERKILPLNEYLEVYGDGADFNGISSRITDINIAATHYLSVFIHHGTDLLTNEKINNSIFSFEKFVGFRAGFYTVAPPFKYVLVLDNNNMERVFRIENTHFELHKII